MSEIKKVVVVGLGYIGLPTAAVIASHGVKVVGVDISEKAVNTINEGKIHIIEPDLDAIVDSVVHKGFLKAQTTPVKADYFVIAVPTPFKGNHEPDLSYVKSAAESIAPFLEKGNTVILESTSPVGTTEQMSKWLASLRSDLSFPDQTGKEQDVFIAYCPERVLPGKVLHELISNDRVIGGISTKCSEKAKTFYQIFVKGDCIITNARTAEMCKLTENSFRDVNIAFANELSVLCDKFGINVWELIGLANRHPRVDILRPGPGVGGHCIAVDPWFIVDSAPKESRIIHTARLVNDYQPHYIINKIKCLTEKFTNPSIACLGLAFKKDIDDLRESPAIEIVRHLLKEKFGKLLVVEPNIKKLPEKLHNENIEFCGLADAIARADIVVVLVDHKEFFNIDKSVLRGKYVIDTRGILEE